ncbi:MAG: STN domain-containing protein [Phycisphaerae bacterium]
MKIQRTILALLAVTAFASAQDITEAQIQKQLDKTIQFSVENMPIEGVFSSLGDEAGLRFELPADTLDFLPYGSQTNLDVKFKNVRLRDALDQLLASQALTWKIQDGKIAIVPTPSLYRMSRRPSFDELQLLAKLHTTRLEPSEKAGDPIQQLRKATGVESLAMMWHLEVPRQDAFRRAEFKLPGPTSDWLDMACHGHGATWYLAGDAIVVLPMEKQIHRQLQTRTSIEAQGRKLIDVLRQLTDAARVEMDPQPGVFALLPESTRDSVSLRMNDVTVEQALKVISGATGLVFTPTAKGVAVEASEFLKQQARAESDTPRRKRPPFFLKVSIPTSEGNVEVFYPADDLPEELVEKILKRREALIEQLGQELAD